MSLFKMGVVPRKGIVNPYSFYPQMIVGTVDGDLSAGESTVNFDTITHPNPLMFARVGDILVLGPSTNVSYKGFIESVAISGVTSTAFSLSRQLTFDYDDGDTWSILGSNFPGGWRVSVVGTDIQPEGNFDTPAVFEGGFLDKNRMKVKFNAFDAGTPVQVFQDLGTDFEKGKVYKSGLYYKTDNSGGNDITASFGFLETLTAGGPGFSAVALPPTANWTHVAAVNGISGLFTSLKMAIRTTAGTSPFYRLFANYFYLCHAWETDDEANGIYTFDDFPELGSVQFDEIPFSQTLKLLDGSSSFYDNLGLSHRRPRFSIRARYKFVSNAFLQQLRILDGWQRQGNLLVFLHETSELLDQGVPPVMVGSLEISPARRKDLWDFDKVSFDLVFTEGS